MARAPPPPQKKKKKKIEHCILRKYPTNNHFEKNKILKSFFSFSRLTEYCERNQFVMSSLIVPRTFLQILVHGFSKVAK